MRTRKDVPVCVAMDRDTLNLLDVLAQEYEANRSFAVRRAVKESAERRGISVAENQEKEKEYAERQ